MKILHGTWIPENTDDYQQHGAFYLWVETIVANRGRKATNDHPHSLKPKPLEDFLKDELGLKDDSHQTIGGRIVKKTFTLPSAEGAPLKSYELMTYLGEDIPQTFELKPWQIHSYPVQTPNLIRRLNDIHFLFLYPSSETRLGADLLFWYHYTQSFKDVLLKDQYIPSLKYRDLPRPKDRRRKKYDKFQIYPAWEIVSETYESAIARYAASMPGVCVSGAEKVACAFSRETLLRHFSENLLHAIVASTPLSAQFEKQVFDTLLYDCIYLKHEQRLWKTQHALENYKQWALWKASVAGHQSAMSLTLYFQLEEAESADDDWRMHFMIGSKTDPSLRLALGDYWRSSKTKRKQARATFGDDLEKQVLLHLGYAARMYPKIWDGLQTNQPTGFELDIDEAFEFLKERAWVLEDGGYKVVIPSWWTPEGRRRAKIRLRTKAKVAGAMPAVTRGLFGLDSILTYQYELSIGNQPVTQNEWDALVNAKTSLVQFRGQWMELDRDKMGQMLEFWKSHADEAPEMGVLDLLKITADDEFEFEHDDVLHQMMEKLHDKSRFELIDEPLKFQGTLRDYQKRGVSWIQYLEHLGLNGCLADDMGLGKTIQVIARLINEREERSDVTPTLLIAPTSVLGNWQKEIQRFAPHLKTTIHHGSERSRGEKEFQKESLKHDVVISSYALARRDAKLFASLSWERIVLDEAQNIKNPQAAQTRAIAKFQAKHRLALTGTPIENRLMDIWSIFNFLNPGYLGTKANFRRSFEIPIHKENDIAKIAVLKRLSEPFILRRVKTDPDVITDLPDKVEQKVYCNLSKEQASLYEAVVKDVMRQIQEKEGIERRGLVLASLMKLKQICNHPAQFLQDGSEFTTKRSHKLSRLADMIEEGIENGESLLIFSQFREICEALEKFITRTLHCPTYLIHGGTRRAKREELIDAFQDTETEAAVFILSLRAGGVGLTLTKANHVFHFHRWWNPAVENQATDRVFRIGQTKNVFVHKFLALGTLEERIDQMIEDKKQLSETIIGNDESWLTELDNRAFGELIALNRASVLDES
ncbi:MAG: DEAD/DEAH box helicase [Candidatus Poribacteria bacterium]|nr:DEAD/DEAH box helicase [Candidatus Poribacteria bacterium]